MQFTCSYMVDFVFICADKSDDFVSEELSGKLKSVLQGVDVLNDKGKVDKGL